MNKIAVKDYAELSGIACEILLEQVRQKPNCVLGLATGSTPLGAYQGLVAAYRAGKISFAQCKSINLDEYAGLAPENPASYHYFMWEHLFSQIDISPENTHLPDGKNPDAQTVCAQYDKLVADLGPIDLQILGIGTNGHIAFNEPADHFVAGTHLVGLDEATIEANARFFDHRDDVPKQAYTLGMGGILNARRVLLLVSGAAKADALHQSLTGPITPQVPASILQLHNHLTIIADEAAWSRFS